MKTLFRNTLSIIILLLFISNISFAQISGQLFQYGFQSPFITVYLADSDQKVGTDVDGHFSLPISSELKSMDLIFKLYDMQVVIKNIELDSPKLDLGEFFLPSFKSLLFEEFGELTLLEKGACEPVSCYGMLLGYNDSNQLNEDFLLLNCKKKITKFDYNTETKTVTVDWDVIKGCSQ